MATFLSGMVIGSVGFVAFVYGRKQVQWTPMVIGAVLMALPYFVQNLLALWATALALVAGLWFFRG